MRWVLFKFLMWLNRGERRGYEEGYWRGWCNALYAVKIGEAAIDKPPVEDTGERKAYPVTAYAPSEQERHTDKIASTTTQQLPGLRFSVAVHRQLQKGAGVDTAVSRAIPKLPRPQ